jgi:hypothetical protein
MRGKKNGYIFNKLDEFVTILSILYIFIDKFYFKLLYTV